MLLGQNLRHLQLSDPISNGEGRKNHNMCEEKNPFLKYSTEIQPVGKVEGKAGDEQGGISRHRVRIVSKRVRLCDADNLVGGVKHLVDALRISQVIPEDDPQAISLEVSQEKVSSYKDEETWVEVSR